MKTRIEVWIDVEIEYTQVNGLRQVIEDFAWDAVNDYRKDNPGSIRSVMVQANEANE